MLQFDLLANNKIEEIELPDALIGFQPNFLDERVSQELLLTLQNTVNWQQETILIAGLPKVSPRLTAWHGDEGADYWYSGANHKPNSWLPELLLIKDKLEKLTQTPFNSALCNWYRDGQDSVAWHSDDEMDLGIEPVIASVSLGASRTFQMKHKIHTHLRHKKLLTSGSLLVMEGKCQSHWLHQVPKEPVVTEPRINITFRNIKK